MSKQTTKGPIRERKVTDCCCLLLFFAFWLLIGCISIYAYAQGNIDNVAKVIDSDGKPCGEGARLDYPYIYINDPYSAKFYTHTVCVKSCPKTNEEEIQCYPNEDIQFCRDLTVRASYSILTRLCVPKIKELGNLVKKTVHLSYVQESIEDIREVWPMFLVAFVVGCLILAVYLCLMRVCTKVFVFLMLLLVLIGLILLGFYCWNQYKTQLEKNSNQSNSEGSAQSTEEKEATEYGQQQAKNWKIAAISLWVTSGIFFLCTLLLCSRIALASDILSSAAQFVQNKPSVFIIPIFFTFMLIMFFIFWIPTFSMLSSVGDLSPDETSVFMNIKWSKTTWAFIFIFFFSLLWGVSFNFSQETFSIAAMAASWYFDRKTIGTISPMRAVCWSFSYHIGTLAFGSLLIAILWAIQLILQYVYQKLKETGSNNTAVGFAVKCAACFVACFERTIKFINKHAYIETALRNLNFCPAAGKCLEVTTTNFLRFGVLSGLTGLFLFLGSIFISCATTFIMHFFIDLYAQGRNIEVDTIAPLLFVFFMTLSICIIFSHVYEIAADTLLHCYVLDEEDGTVDGSIGGNCPDVLKRTLNNHSIENKL